MMTMLKNVTPHKTSGPKSVWRQSIPEVEAWIAEYQDFLDSQPDGALVRWEDFEEHFHRKMTTKQRDYVRTALKKSQRPYEPVRKQGVRLSSPDTAVPILRGKLLRVNGAVRIAKKVQRQLQERHLPLMSPKDQATFILSAAWFGALDACSQMYKKEFARARSVMS